MNGKHGSQEKQQAYPGSTESFSTKPWNLKGSKWNNVKVIRTFSLLVMLREQVSYL